jgi:proline iminopeptidase
VSDTITRQAIDAKYNSIYRCRDEPTPEPLARARRHANRKIKVIDRDDWNIKERLTLIKQPTLIIGAKHDFVDETDLEFMNKQIQNSSLYICPEGSHFAFWDDSQNYFRELEKFILLTLSAKK